jgi:hypothetical protein
VGLISDFVVATPEDALQYESFQEGKALPPGRFERAEYKNFTSLALEMLWAVLRHEKWDVRYHRLEHVFHTESTLLERFPDELVHRLSALSETDQNRVAVAWVHPEVPGNVDELRPVLRDLQRLSTLAQTSGRSMYLWVSL